MQLKAKKTEYTFTPDDIKILIADNLKVPVGSVHVHFRIQEVGPALMDRFPGTTEVTEIKVTVNHSNI